MWLDYTETVMLEREVPAQGSDTAQLVQDSTGRTEFLAVDPQRAVLHRCPNVASESLNAPCSSALSSIPLCFASQTLSVSSVEVV